MLPALLGWNLEFKPQYCQIFLNIKVVNSLKERYVHSLTKYFLIHYSKYLYFIKHISFYFYMVVCRECIIQVTYCWYFKTCVLHSLDRLSYLHLLS
jgi:hypothetical protein